jgi:adenylate kinase family enzyme
MKRIHIIGSTGSGKTSLAAEISAHLAIPHVELDDLYWGESWQEADLEDFRSRLQLALSVDAWVVDGNYSKVRDIIWSRVQMVVWLDYPVVIPFVRLFRRSMRRVIYRELLWGRNRESFRAQFFSRESLFVYLFRTHWSRREMYASLAQESRYASIRFVQLRSPREMRRWLKGFVWEHSNRKSR